MPRLGPWGFFEEATRWSLAPTRQRDGDGQDTLARSSLGWRLSRFVTDQVSAPPAGSLVLATWPLSSTATQRVTEAHDASSM